MADFERDMQPTPKYGDPAPLGGSFVIDCLTMDPTVSGQLPVVKQEDIDAFRASEKAAEYGAKATHKKRAPKKDPSARREIRQAQRSVCRSIFEMIEDSADCDSAGEWARYWRDHVDAYLSRMETLHALSEQLGPTTRQMKGISDAAFVDVIAKKFPEAAGEIAFLTNVIDGASKQTAHFEPVDESKRARDFEFAERFRFWGGYFSMCMLTLDCVASGLIEMHKVILDQIFSMARHSALEFNDAAMEAAALRRPEMPRTQTDENVDIERSSIADDLEDVEMRIREFESGGS